MNTIRVAVCLKVTKERMVETVSLRAKNVSSFVNWLSELSSICNIALHRQNALNGLPADQCILRRLRYKDFSFCSNTSKDEFVTRRQGSKDISRAFGRPDTSDKCNWCPGESEYMSRSEELDQYTYWCTWPLWCCLVLSARMLRRTHKWFLRLPS